MSQPLMKSLPLMMVLQPEPNKTLLTLPETMAQIMLMKIMEMMITIGLTT